MLRDAKASWQLHCAASSSEFVSKTQARDQTIEHYAFVCAHLTHSLDGDLLIVSILGIRSLSGALVKYWASGWAGDQ